MEEFNRNNFKSSGSKKGILVAIVICIILIILLACLVLFYRQMDENTFKLYIDDNKVSCSKDFYILDDKGNTYVKARELAGLIGWIYQNGEFASYTEDKDSGYIQNQYEAASFVSGSNILKKYIQKSPSGNVAPADGEQPMEIVVSSSDGSLEITTLSLPIILNNNQIYLPLESLNDICNCMVSYQNNKMYIYEMNYLQNRALEKAFEYGYASVSGTYENLRALAYGVMIVNNSGKFGAVTLYGNEQLLGFKYTDMVFCQNVKEFFVKADDTVGVVSMNGDVIISPKNYDNISVLSDELGLYLIEKDSLFGVLNREGDVVVFAEYNGIGMSEEMMKNFKSNNRYLLYNNTIIVSHEGKYGLYSLDGKNKLPVSYEGLGCVANEDSGKDGDSVLTMEAKIETEDGTATVKGIVVEKTDLSGESVYGVYDAVQERLIIPCVYSRIYSITKTGVTTYYMEFDGEQIEFSEFIKEQNLY